MRLIFKGLCVDAGNLSCMLKSEINYEKSKLVKTHKIEKGLYRVTLSSKDTWNGISSSVGFINVKKKTDTLIIGDACYSIQEDKWSEFLDKTGFLGNMHGFGVCMNTGGDGSFNLTIKIEPIKEEPLSEYEIRINNAKEFIAKNINKADTINKLKKLEEKFREKFINKQLYSPIINDIRDSITDKIHEKQYSDLDKRLNELK